MDEEEIFRAVHKREDPAERAVYLDEVCGGDRRLRSAVEALLTANDEAGVLDTPPIHLDATVLQAPLMEQPGTVIGRYKLLELIGEGGFGVVYVAEQTEPMRRKVALKIIKPGMDTRQVIARFEAERQALALMDHPNIAKVLDAGATDSGRPYFVMELILGLPITEHCDQNNLTTKARLELFIDVCHALQHAHLEGIIHRDIKPSNVIVTLVDGRPVPKVIDFGIAKATQKRLAEKTITTGDGQFLGTPQYMSPEQAGMSDLHVDIRTDIYSLGVVLYELLVGRTPCDPKQLHDAGYDEVCRIIRESDPPTPSKQLSTLGAAAEETSKQRQVQSKVLWKLLHGDLDCIVMKTLAQDRDDRYATAEALANDLQRFLDDKPIEAKRRTAVERAAKWSRRHSWGVAISIAATFGILLAVAMVMWYGQRREAALRAQSEAQRDRAEDNLQLAFDAMDQLNQELAPKIIFNGWGDKPADQLRFTPEEEKCLRELLAFYEQFTTANRGVASAQSKNARAYERIGSIHSQLGSPHEAHAALNKATEIAAKLIAAYPTAVETKKCVAGIHAGQGFASYLTGDLERAINELTKAIQIDPTEPWAFLLRGTAYRRRGDLKKAIDDFTAAIRLEPNYPGTYNQRAMAYTDKGDFEKAIPDYQEAIRRHPTSHMRYNNLGYMYSKKGDTEQALAAFAKAIYLNSDSAETYTNRAMVLLETGEFDKAIADLTEVIRIDPQRAYAYHGRGSAYHKLDNPEEAIADFTEAIRLAHMPASYRARGDVYMVKGGLDRAIADFTKSVRLVPHGNTYNSLGFAHEKRGDLPQALTAYSEAIRVDPKHAFAYNNRGQLHIKMGDLEHAITDLNEAIQLDPKFSRPYFHRGCVYSEQGHIEKGLADLAKAVELAWRADVFSAYALALLVSGNMDGYRGECARMLDRFGTVDEVDRVIWTAWTCVLAPNAVDDPSITVKLAEKTVRADPKSVVCVRTLGAALYRAGQVKQAIKRLNEADQMMKATDEAAQLSPAYTWYFLSMAHHADGHDDKARQWLDKAVKWTNDRIRTNKQKDGTRLMWNRRLTLNLLRAEAESLLAASPN